MHSPALIAAQSALNRAHRKRHSPHQRDAYQRSLRRARRLYNQAVQEFYQGPTTPEPCPRDTLDRLPTIEGLFYAHLDGAFLVMDAGRVLHTVHTAEAMLSLFGIGGTS